VLEYNINELFTPAISLNFWIGLAGACNLFYTRYQFINHLHYSTPISLPIITPISNSAR
jgi:hypothetical protein